MVKSSFGTIAYLGKQIEFIYPYAGLDPKVEIFGFFLLALVQVFYMK